MERRIEHAKKPDTSSGARVYENVKPRELTPFESKVNDISSLAVREPEGFDPAETFLTFLAMRRSVSYRESKKAYPNEPERLIWARRTLGEIVLGSQAEVVNDWLSSRGRPELQLTVDEIVKIMYGD